MVAGSGRQSASGAQAASVAAAGSLHRRKTRGARGLGDDAGAVLQVELPEGTRAAYNKNALLATSPWYTDAGLTDGGVDVAALGRFYDNAIREHPEFAASGRSVTVHSIFSPARLGPAQGATRGRVNVRAGVAVKAQIRARRRERMEACRGGAVPIQSQSAGTCQSQAKKPSALPQHRRRLPGDATSPVSSVTGIRRKPS